MDAGSRSTRDFDDDDGDDFAARREVSSSFKEFGVRIDGKGGNGSGNEQQRPSTPRSKHSATEQRRRSKINDRFQILRELLPHTDQKRDKASFLLEVIEYIRFLQEKVHKYELSFPECNQDNPKLMPWENIYFRSFWKNTQNKGQALGDFDPSQVEKNGSASQGYAFPGKLDDNNLAASSAPISTAHERGETDPVASASYRSGNTPTNHADNVTSEDQLRASGALDCGVNHRILDDEELIVDDGVISLSTQYSQELLGTLSRALENSGIDLSQANLSVQITLGKRSAKRSIAEGAISSSKELREPVPSNMEGTEEEPASKRFRPENI